MSTEFDPALPRPPLSEYTPIVMKTLRENQHLFKIVSPVNVEVFESLLVDHPNQPFVRSIIVGLREGFWPWADTQPGVYPDTYDLGDCPLKTEKKRQFVRDQRDAEIAAGRFSPSFGPDLLPGMYSMPIHAVPKPQSEKLRLVVNHKAGEFSLNSMIPREAIAGARLDTLKNLGDRLLALRRVHGPDTDLVVWKSDVSQAYRRLPMHPLWQVKQIVTIDGERHVDRCNNFGNRGAGRIWTSFMGLVNWIANRKGIPSKLYIDDTFSADLACNTSYYPPYKSSFPTPQTRTLQLWDRLGVNHEHPKQLSGEQIPVVGFDVNANAMTFTMPESKRAELLAAVEEFCRVPPGGRRHPLRKFQSLAGWMNWSFNVYFLLKPALSHIYAKMAGKTNGDAPIFVNQGVVNDLAWFSRHVRNSTGVHLLESLDWEPPDADIVAYCDASLKGLGIYFPLLGVGYQSKPPKAAPDNRIFYYEAFCICWCLHEISRLVTIWTDSSNTYDMFNSLRALPLYNEILKSSIDVLIDNDFKLRVVLLPGKKNVVADALSRWKNADAIAYHPTWTFIMTSQKMIELSRTSRQPAREAWTLDRLIHERSIVLGFAIDPSTSSTYTSALNSYITFCRMHNFSLEPTPETLSFFTVYMSHHIKPDSVDSYLSGICNQLEDHFPDVRKNRNSRLVAKTLAGCKRMRGTATKRKQPLSTHNLVTVVDWLKDRIARGVAAHDDYLFTTQLLTGFYALLRLGELTYPDKVALRNPRKVSQRISVSWRETGYGYFLPGHKADAFFEGNALMIEKLTGPADPSWFIARLRKFFPNSVAGQSMRAGGATRLAEAGALPHVIQAAGRWASDTFQIYIRKNPILLQGLIYGRPAFDGPPLRAPARI
ncbi:hypothetical protein C8F04DRAFT_1207029 [Mycena alexandri]|uniref:Reverse transcriptase domain-containing protein n=1 Tax=Mycena alexandri TaxID=1745969 RepID=A0AAD6TE21_9AGAR|nr:hypothetical protein C8F04DRAFT_1207029 [Mycena alexandri]